MTRPIAATALVVLFSGTFACQRAPPSTQRTSLMPDAAPRILTAESVFDPVPRFDWDLRSGRPEAAGPGFGAGLEHRPGQGLVLTGPVELRWPVDLDAEGLDAEGLDAEGLDAEGLDAVHLTLQYPHGSEAELYWRRAEEGFDAARSLRQRRGDGRAGLGRTLIFETLGHPEWSGRITELKVRFGLGPQESRALERVRGLSYRMDPETLATTADETWLADLGHEYRAAVLAPPGRPITRRVALVGRGTLRFAYGMTAGRYDDVEFRISRRTGPAAPEVLFSARLTPDQDQPRRWHDATVSLTGDGTVDLLFETFASGSGKALPLWANLELVPEGAVAERPNILLISVDTLRADHLPFHGYAEPTAPYLTRWARRLATVFEHAVVQAPWTLPSHASMLTGVNATRHGVNHTHTVVPESLSMLAERLRDAGYSTAAVTGGAFLHPKYGFGQGFDRFAYWPTLGEPENELETGVGHGLGLLETLTPPFFLFLHTFDVHDYLIYRRAAGADDSIVRWYDDRIRHTDRQLGRLLDGLDALGLRGRTAVALTSDHGEALGEGGERGHGFLSEDNLRVPLVVELPGRQGAGRRVTRLVRSVDLMPTLLEVAGLPVPAGLDGRSLLPLLEDEAADFPESATSYAAKRNLGLALIRDRFKYVFPNSAWPSVRGEDRLVDLRRGSAPTPAPAPAGADLEAWREQARRELESLPGIRLRFTNASDPTLFFRLRSRWLTHEGVKASRLPCPCVHREAPFQTLVTTPPGTDFELQLEEVALDAIVLEAWRGSADGRSEIRDSVRVGPDRAAWQLRLEDGAWRSGELRSGELDRPAPSGLTVRWQDGLDPSSTSPIEADADLEQRLRALGYLD